MARSKFLGAAVVSKHILCIVQTYLVGTNNIILCATRTLEYSNNNIILILYILSILLSY